MKLSANNLTCILYRAVCLATRRIVKCKVLSASEKLDIIKKEQRSILMSVLNNITSNKTDILQQFVTTLPGRKGLKTS
jgi:hypothetical protein